jgi:hypothetical protein
VANFPQWEYDLLKALGAPASKNNLTALNLWAQSEGSVTNNPLATSGQGAGATVCVAQCGSTSPIYEYDTEADGVAQMARFLKGSYYTSIVRAFTDDAGLAAIFQAINSSPWCKGCQNGQYPVDLSQAVGGKDSEISTTVGSGAAPGQKGAAAGSSLSQCVIQAPGFLFLSGPCFLTKGGVKWLSGAVCIWAGAVMAGFGVVLLASAVGKSTGATETAKKGARTIGIGGALLAGQPEAAAGIAQLSKTDVLGSAAKKAGAKSVATRKASDKQAAASTWAARAPQLRESNRTANDIAATYRPRNQGLSRQSTNKNADFLRRKREANQKAKAANF